MFATRIASPATLLVTALSLAPTALGQDAGPKPIELPLSRAVLHASGVGYFEHAGAVEGGGVIRLSFGADQINDVLKSMVLMDLDGGRLTTVTYPSNDPIARSLKSFGVDISGNPPLHELLQQLRGAQITVMAPEKISGSILNVESRERIIGEPPASITEHTLNLVTAAGIRAIPMSTIASLELTDEKLREELNKALAMLVASRDTDRRPVDIAFEGKGKRRVRVGYLVETPVWKTSYRLDLSGVEAKSAAGGPLLQGWAIVENTSASDWKAVTLSLVSGRPISFVQDLYTPFYLPRPVVVPPHYASLTPRRYDEGMDAADKAVALQEMGQYRMAERDGAGKRAAPGKPGDADESRSVRRSMGGSAAMAPPPAALPADISLAQGVQSMSQAASLGELFQFTIQQPVDMPRRRSAMLAIVNETVAAEKVSIYNQSVLANHPLNGVWLTNSTALKLPDGPVTVFDGGSYAGDAQVDHLAPGDKRLLSYAVDLSVTVDPSVNSSDRIVAGKIVQGVLQISRLNAYSQVYTIKNKADAARVMVIEHPFRSERKLIEPTTFAEKTPTLYRFRASVEPGKTGAFTVKEEQTVEQRVMILDQSPDQLAWFVKNGDLSDAVRSALGKAIAYKRELSTLEAKLNALTQEMNTIKQGQERLRENLKSVGGDSTLGKRYLAKLNDEESRIEQLDSQITETRKQVEAKRAELAEYLGSLTLG